MHFTFKRIVFSLSKYLFLDAIVIIATFSLIDLLAII